MRAWIGRDIISNHYKAHWRVRHSLNMICPRVFIHIGLKFPSNREDLLVEMCIFLGLVPFGPCRRGEKVGNKQNNISSETIFWDVPHPDPLV